MITEIASSVSNIFGFLKKKENNFGIRVITKLVNRLKKACNIAEDIIIVSRKLSNLTGKYYNKFSDNDKKEFCDLRNEFSKKVKAFNKRD